MAEEEENDSEHNSDFPALSRLTSEEQLSDVVAELSTGQPAVRTRLLADYIARYRNDVLIVYEEVAELRQGPQAAWPAFRRLLDMVEELEEDLTLTALHQAATTREHDKLIQRLWDDVHRVSRRIKRFAEQVERNVQANMAAGYDAHGARGNSEIKKVPAIKKLKLAEGTKFDKSETTSIEEFCRAADKQFDNADNNADPKLDDSDKIMHVNSLIVGLADKDLESAINIARETGTLPTTWNYKSRSTTDYSYWLITVVFNDKLRGERNRRLYDEDVKKGYYTNPDAIIKALLYKQHNIGKTSSNAVTNQQLLQDYTNKMLPGTYMEKINADDTYKAFVNRDKADAAARERDALAAALRASELATEYYKAAQQTLLAGAPTTRAARTALNALADTLPADDDVRLAVAAEREQQRDDDVVTPSAALAAAAERLERVASMLTGRMGDRFVGEEKVALLDDDGDAEIAAVANHNSLLAMGHAGDVAASLAQREYNKAKRQELADMKAETGTDMSKIRCYNCGEFGHMARACHKPPTLRRTPFRRLRRRPPLRGQRGMQPNRINVNLYRKESGTNRFTRIQEHENINSIDFCNECIYAAEDGMNEAHLDAFFIIA
jgi:hypothetical protein